MKKHRKVIKNGGDIWILFFVILLSIFGIMMMYNASIAIGVRDFSDPLYFFKEQLRGLAIGSVLLSLFSFIHYSTWKKISVPFLLITMILLLLVFIPGIGVHALGARRWIRIAGIVVQPAEIAKLATIIYLSHWFSGSKNIKLFSFLLFLGVVVGLIMAEPDMGTSIILVATALLLYFSSTAPLWHFLVIAPLVVSASGILAVISPYRFGRLLTFLNPERDPQGASYQIKQALLAIGSGGFWGLGLGMSRQKYAYLPEANTDSIFAIIAEEVGFIGCVLLITVYLGLIWRGLYIAKSVPDAFGKLLAIGITGLVGIQAALNISAMMALMPLTGVPLPFMSYGSSGLVVTLASYGILMSISRYAKESGHYEK